MTEPDPFWRDRAACKGMDVSVFFPEPNRGNPDFRPALTACAQCPIRDRCLSEALVNEGQLLGKFRHGVFGGLTPEQRASLARRQARVNSPVRRDTDLHRFRLWQQGWSDQQVADELGLDVSSYRGWRQRRGLESNYMAGSREVRA